MVITINIKRRNIINITGLVLSGIIMGILFPC
jgi:hypothetical protein